MLNGHPVKKRLVRNHICKNEREQIVAYATSHVNVPIRLGCGGLLSSPVNTIICIA